MNDFIYLDSSNLIRVKGLHDEVTGDYLNSATVTATLYDADEAAVTGAETLSLAYEAASDGNYSGVIPATVTLSRGDLYKVKVTATSGSYVSVWWVSCRAARRPD